MGEVALIETVRTPHGSLLGSLAEVSAVELGRTAIDGLLERTELEGARFDWVGLGNAIQAGIGQVPARQAVVASNLPPGTPTTTVNEASGSGLRAIALASDRLRAGRASFAIAGGFESMSNAPWILPGLRRGKRHGDVTLKDSMILDSLWDVSLDVHMGEITEGLVDQAGVSRESQDRYALESHRRATNAIEAGDYDAEIVPVETADRIVDRDEGPRPESSIEDLQELPAAFRREGSITAGNASNLADGAGVVLLADAAVAAETGLDPSAHLVDYAVSYRPPAEFNEAVGDVIEKLLDRNDLDVSDLDTCWVNEAFAAQSVYVMERLGIPRERMNPRGGAIAYGHPIGASGGMLTASLVHELRQEGLTRGIVGMSIGGGGAIMALVER